MTTTTLRPTTPAGLLTTAADLHRDTIRRALTGLAHLAIDTLDADYYVRDVLDSVLPAGDVAKRDQAWSVFLAAIQKLWDLESGYLGPAEVDDEIAPGVDLDEVRDRLMDDARSDMEWAIRAGMEAAA